MCSESGPHLSNLYQRCSALPPVPTVPSGVEPKIVRLGNGLLVVSSGRPGIYIWIAQDPTAKWMHGSNVEDPHTITMQWHGFNIAAAHNLLYHDTDLHFSSVTPSQDETTSYTGLVSIQNENAVIVSYDRLANGWNPAPFPPGNRGLSAIFTIRLDIGLL